MVDISRRSVLGGGVAAVGLLGVAACGSSGSSSTSSSSASASATPGLSLQGASWKYDSTNDVYYLIGRAYVQKPQASDYETLGIYVPGKYVTGTKNSDGSYAVTASTTGTVNGLTAKTAPIVFPVNTPGYAAQKPPTSYSYDEVSSYMKAGFVYVAAGLRGKDSQSTSYTGNAPWGVVDLKAAVRFIKYQGDALPGDKTRMFVFGHSGGGAQSAVMGASGDHPSYTPYLSALGAAMTDADGKTISDAIAGAMCWCPITTLDYANAAYEWNMGQFASIGTRAAGTWTKAYSTDLATAFADYQNMLAVRDSSGKTLSLEKSSTGTFLKGSYYDHLVSVVQDSLNAFLGYTTFPYTPNNQTMAGMGGSGGGAPSGSGAPSGAMPSGAAPSGAQSGSGAPSGAAAASSSSSSTTYNTVTDYIAYLNQDSTWVRYDATTKKATVLNLRGFVISQKNASKDVGAFDGVSRGQTENVVMGLNTAGLHFAQVSKGVIARNQSAYAKLTNWKSDYGADAYTTDFAKKDSAGTTVLDRVDMYNPMYYLSPAYKGYRKSTVAPHWRVRTGIKQGDTASTTEVNLALALQNLGKTTVDFATVWGLGHTQAETTGDATTNFITWVRDSVK